MDEVREILRYHHYSIRTEQAFVSWILQFFRFNGKLHPKKMDKPEIERFLSRHVLYRFAIRYKVHGYGTAHCRTFRSDRCETVLNSVALA
jgi:hypothetical protein